MAAGIIACIQDKTKQHMTEPTLSGAAKSLDILRQLPFWLLLGVGLACAILLFVPIAASELPRELRPWLVGGGVLFGSLSIVRIVLAVAALANSRLALARARPAVHFASMRRYDFWTANETSNGAFQTQLRVGFLARNNGAVPVGLVSARLLKPRWRIWGKVLHVDVLTQHPRSNVFGSPFSSLQFALPSNVPTPVSAHFIIEGRPIWIRSSSDLNVTVEFEDDTGARYRARSKIAGTPVAPAAKAITQPAEALHAVSNPVEKSIAAILQDEVARYTKNGRSGGGLGSIHLVVDGQVRGLGTDSWTPNSPINQAIATNPEKAQLASDNLDALLSVYRQQQAANEQDAYVQFLIRRLGGEYILVAYLVVAALWKIGRFEEALPAVLALPANDSENFGLSNVLMMLNGLLRHRHPDFSASDLDAIDRLVSSTVEHTFMIREKTAAIRANAARQSA